MPLTARAALRFESWRPRVQIGHTQLLSTGNQAQAVNPLVAGHPSLQRVPTPTSTSLDVHPCVFHLGTFGHRSEGKPFSRLLTPLDCCRSVPQSAQTFAAPFFTRLDPGEGDSLRSPVVGTPHGAR